MDLFSKAIQFSNNSQKKYFDAALNMDIEFIKKNLKDKINCFSYNEKKLKKDIFTKSIK